MECRLQAESYINERFRLKAALHAFSSLARLPYFPQSSDFVPALSPSHKSLRRAERLCYTLPPYL